MNIRRIPGRIVRAQVRGFTLIEVMVALFVTAVGLLGIAKIQALAYASTGSASVRSLVAMETAGLAAAMHANRSYWAATPPSPITINQANVLDPTLGPEGLPISPTLGYCQLGSGNTPCTAELMAASDLHTYATALSNLLPNADPTTTITCSTASLTTPLNCEVQVTWNEKAASISKASATATTQCSTASASDPCQFNPTYTLYVEP